MRSSIIVCFTLFFVAGAWADDLLGLPPITIPADNPQSPEKIALGKRLFNDKRFSADGSISCASCHEPKRAFTDGLAQAKGINQQLGTRNSPTVVNAALYDSFFVDGRAGSLEQQALGPLTNPIEHGLSSHQAVIKVIRKDSDYRQAFKQVFGIKKYFINIDHVTKAIASYERTLVYGNSAFDRFFFKADQTALSESAKRGSRVFRRKGNCANCHEISFNNARFTDNRFYNIGVGFRRLTSVLDQYLQSLSSGSDDEVSLSDAQKSELGRFSVTKAVSDLGKFKVPTLRNIALTGPYMHDGSFKTLREVVDYYDRGGDKNPYIDPAIFPLQFTEQEKTDLVVFLKSLTSAKYTSGYVE